MGYAPDTVGRWKIYWLLAEHLFNVQIYREQNCTETAAKF